MKLGVNIDHVATLRQQRKEDHPDPLFAALTAQQNGADSIVAHLREDRRHIQERDIRLLKQALKIPLAMEIAATEDMERLALDVVPARVCIVPEKRQELTTEGGLDVITHRTALKKLIQKLSGKKVDVSLLIDPDADQVRCAKSLGAGIVEIHTGRYAQTKGNVQQQELSKILKALELAVQLKLHLHAGHGLDYQNVQAIARIPGMEELNIGFSIVAKALVVGFASAVREMKEIIACAA